jgi:hypothetical protein
VSTPDHNTLVAARLKELQERSTAIRPELEPVPLHRIEMERQRRSLQELIVALHLAHQIEINAARPLSARREEREKLIVQRAAGLAELDTMLSPGAIAAIADPVVRSQAERRRAGYERSLPLMDAEIENATRRLVDAERKYVEAQVAVDRLLDASLPEAAAAVKSAMS